MSKHVISKFDIRSDDEESFSKSMTNFEDKCGGNVRVILVTGILKNLSKVELQLSDSLSSNAERVKFLNGRLVYYEKLLREVSGLTTLS